MASTFPRHDRVRVYLRLRSVHLERFHELEPASVLHQRQSYDFDQALLAGLDLERYDGLGGLFARLWRSRVRALEINEPLTLGAVPNSVVAVLAVRLRGMLTRRRTSVVTYAIENLDPFSTPNPRLRSRWRRTAYRWAVAYLVRNTDRLAFGTPGAEATYAPFLRGFRGVSLLVPALPAPCGTCPPDLAARQGEEPGHEVVFLGAFDDRKGLRQLLEAWPAVVERVPDARLHVLGKGEHLELAEEAARRPDVTLVVDPSREEIHRTLRTSRVLVLVSQPSETWREQVGLPIVEALSHGVEIVASEQTGVAAWLTEHGHRVVDSRTASPDDLADAVAAALTSPRTRAEVLAELPGEDGRLAADHWLFSEKPD
ncbi:MAG: glycosyltransferase [Aeromicrobium sp.]